ncbi:MAG: ABC transporter substrate-binding protein [Firmicutes bacterium]|nr:ABC transporter substrate-binding protein [Bacillota bacterium]
MRRTWNLFVVGLLVCLLVSGTALAKVKITYWTGWGGEELEDLKVVIEEFHKANPDIEVETTTIFGAYEKLLTAIAGGRGPDVVSAVWASQLAGLAHHGALQPLDKYIEASSVVSPDDFFPAIWKSFQYQGHVWALAATTNTNFEAYNKEFFREVGLDPEAPPKTLKEFEDVIRKLTIWDSEGELVRLGYLPSGLLKWGYVFGGEWLNEETNEITADHPRNVAALQWLGDFWAEYGVEKLQKFSAGFGNYWSPNNPFMVGKLAIQNYGEWIESFRVRYNPSLDYGVFATPYPEGGRPNVTTFGGSVFAIPVGSKNPEAAWRFIEWITGPEGQKRLARVFTNMPPRADVARDPELLEEIPILKFGLSLLEGPNAFADSVPIPVWEQYLAELGRAEEAVTRGVAKPEEALKEVKAIIERELQKIQ